MRRLVLATRGSKLALAQSEMVANALRAAHPRLAVELRIVQTKGDLVLDRALSQIGDKGVFVKEIEQALVDREADFAVHSCKDLPSLTPDGLALAAFPRRADPRDVLISRHHVRFADLPQGAKVGTSSLRRACQIRQLRSDVQIVDLRGNVDTRLRKAHTDAYDAIVLAAAGLQRLDLDQVVTEFFDPATILPMVAQGALAIECRADDHDLRELLAPLNDPPTELAVAAERAFLRRLEGGCQVPIAAYATVERGEGSKAARERGVIRVRGLIGMPDGSQIVRGELVGSDAETVGVELAEALLRAGGQAILERLSRIVAAAEAPGEAA